MHLMDSILTVAGELFVNLGLDRGLDLVGRTEGRGGNGWVRVFEGPDDARRLAERTVVRMMHAEQGLALVDALGLDDQR